MSAPLRPASMPAIRRDLLAATQQHIATLPAFPDPVTDQVRAQLAAWQQQLAALIPLYWVSAPMSALAADAATDIPAWTPEAVMPETAGLIGFQDTLPLDPAGEAPLFCPLISWQPHPGGQLAVRAYTRGEDVPPGVRERLYERLRVPEWVPAWTVTLDRGEPVHYEAWNDDVGNLVRFIGACWILMQMPTLAQARPVTVEGARIGHRKRDVPREVKIIDLRRLAHDTTEEATPTGGRIYTHRWVVRGHWRTAHVGPGKAQRRLTYVAPHIKGPPGAPLLTGETVSVWRR